MEPSKAPAIFLKPYNSAEQEPTIRSRWEKADYANPDTCIEKHVTKPDAETFSIVLPPPNVTGILHMGSALMLAIEDTLVRFERMRGKRVLWIPGADSAAIATQSRVEKDIQKAEKKSRHDLGREELLRRIEAFVEENKNIILSQMRALGASLDWSRYAYTMDEQRGRAVTEAFVKMHEAGLIERANRIVNWDPKGQTTIADDEIVYEERDAKLYTFRYSKKFPILVATTRPETKVGDAAVAVHPDDERYKMYVGKEYDIESFCGVPLHIKVVADKEVDPAFGTGAVGITPAHSMIDWEIAARHGIPYHIVIDERARMSVEGELNGKKTTEAREAVVEWLRTEKLLEGEDVIKQNIATAERTGGIIEPMPKLQWWIRVDKPFTIAHSEIPGIPSGTHASLKQIMRAAAENGAMKFVSDRYERVYYNWIDNLRDWCISRQIWFGHRIPVWYRNFGQESLLTQSTLQKGNDDMYVGAKPPNDGGWEQDSDVLDTWFSAGLWTFSTLGWPDKTDDLAKYHPTSLIESGYDILFFWIARMVLMSGFFLGQVPFREIYLHGLVRDGQGRKISKSLGNNIDPLDMGAKYGMDAVRVSLIAGMAPGTDSRISEDKIRGYKHFANKIWNIARFVLEQEPSIDAALLGADEELIREAHRTAAIVTDHIESFRLDLAFEATYQFVWHRFADEIIEGSKEILKGSEAAARRSRAAALYQILLVSLKLLHPFMPFVTEAIWQELPDQESDLLMVARWPDAI